VCGCILLLLFMIACAKYTMHSSRVKKVDPMSTIALAVWTPDEMYPSLSVLEGYMTTAIMSRGFAVYTMRLEMLAGSSMLRRIFPEGAYSAGKGFSKGMARGGRIEGETGFLEKTLERNEVVDAELRFEGLIRLANRLPKEWGVQYLLVVHRFAEYGFASYVIQLEEKKIVNAFVITGNEEGFVEALGDPRQGRFLNADDGDGTNMELLRVADHIANGL